MSDSTSDQLATLITSERPCLSSTTPIRGGSFVLASSPALAARSPVSPESAGVLSTCTIDGLSRRAATRFHVKTSWRFSALGTTGSSTHGGRSRSRSESAARTTTATSGHELSASVGSTPPPDPRCPEIHPTSSKPDRCQRPVGHAGDHVSFCHFGEQKIYPAKWDNDVRD